MGWSGQRFRSVVLGGLCSLALAATAAAEVTTERSASILVFPKVLFEDPAPGATTDTIIQISNTSNSVVYAHCFYVNAAPFDPELPPGPTNPRQWQEVDFDIVLTRQQPTHWRVSEGRTTNPFDPACSLRGTCVGGADEGAPCEFPSDCQSGLCSNTMCEGAGFDPGRIPPVPPGFEGELKCIEVDQSGAPISGNHLKGEATLLSTPAPRAARKYNAIGLLGFDTNNSDNVLCLGGEPRASCPTGAEYTGCPDVLFTTHYAEGASNPAVRALLGQQVPVFSELTLVPCTQDFERQIPARVVVQFVVYNEFEEPFSTSTTVECWENFRLGEINPIFSEANLGTRYAQTRMVSAGADPGLVGVMEELHGPTEGRTAFNLHVSGERALGDLVVVPERP
ncbi:MAG: hypothetical protein KatS3mg076_2333 [Candidatus Binatia bacterium]|nr:MAG: hypothetical protein KatS3mg076_2333 [Candidatus Binatia bacterium]